MRKYSSKRAIYRDFPIAIKFILDEHNGLREEDYKKVRDVLCRDCAAKIKHISDEIKGMEATHPVSAGFFVEIPTTAFTGRESFVLLQHENGLEAFVKDAATSIEWLPQCLSNLICSWLARKALAKLVGLLRARLSDTVQRNVRITHVEIRTEHKGVMRLPFPSFFAYQIGCLAKKFKQISHLCECNAPCFGGEGTLVNERRDEAESAKCERQK